MQITTLFVEVFKPSRMCYDIATSIYIKTIVILLGRQRAIETNDFVWFKEQEKCF